MEYPAELTLYQEPNKKSDCVNSLHHISSLNILVLLRVMATYPLFITWWVAVFFYLSHLVPLGPLEYPSLRDNPD
jgi:hypothetical protein